MGSMGLCLFSWRVFVLLLPFKVRGKQIEMEKQEINLFGFLCVHLTAEFALLCSLPCETDKQTTAKRADNDKCDHDAYTSNENLHLGMTFNFFYFYL